MKNSACLIGLFLCCFNLFSQVGINTTTPNAQLEISSSNQVAPANTDGIIIPKIDAFPVVNPTVAQNGMMVFLTTIIGVKTPGFYYWDNATVSWVGISSTANGDKDWFKVGTTTAPNNITDDMFHDGKVGIGNLNPLSKLHVMNVTTGMIPNPSSIATIENSTDTYLSLLSNSESGILFGANGNSTNGAIIYNPTGIPNGMAFRTNNNANQMIITAAGNFSIGNFIPNYPLHFNSILGDKISLWGGVGPHYGFGIQGGLMQIHSSDAASDIAFGYGSSGAFTEAMRIKGNGSVGIGVTVPNAKLQINSSNQVAPANTDGIIIPKIDAFPTVNPTIAQNGMMVFLTTTIGVKTPGFYYWDNASIAWVEIGFKNWGLKGNSGTSATTNFIGTTDNNDFSFRRNSVRAGKIELGNTSLGVNSFNPLNSGISNTAIGDGSLSSNTTANYNTAIGTNALNATNTGTRNTGIGVNSLFLNTIGGYNTATGVNALRNNTTAFYNTAMGSEVLFNNTIGTQNVALGSFSMHENTIGNYNTANGVNSLFSNTSGNENVANGTSALHDNTFGSYNVGMGMYALYSNMTGINNVAVGSYALANSNILGNNNTGIGGAALDYTSGSDNTGLGYHSGYNITTGSNNITIGSGAFVQNPTASNQMSIANVVYGTGLNSAASGKIGIGATDPNAKLQINSSNQAVPANTDGILIPKIDAFPAVNPTAAQNGMMVYLTTPIGIQPAGFYYWQTANFPSSWVAVGSKSGWGIAGNSGTIAGTNFIGTTDNADIVFKRGNTRIGQLSSNIAFGLNALNVTSTGTAIVAVGAAALAANATGSDNTAIGNASMISNINGSRNTSIGSSGMGLNTSGNDNTTLGYAALFANSTGNFNTATGKSALFKNDIGQSNTASGTSALSQNISGSNNTASGDSSLYWNDTGSNNVGIGYHAGYFVQGSNNIAIGTNTNVYNANANDQLSIGNVIYGSTMNSTTAGKIGIGETDPNAKLQITSSNQMTPANTDGILIPKVDAFPALSPTAAQNGMMVFLTTTTGTKAPGFYYWDNLATSWISIGTKSNWSLNGNSGTNPLINFIGTSDNNDVSLRTNNTEVVRMTATGKVGIGVAIPAAELEVNGFTKSGSNAPAVKLVKLTGTSGASQGAATAILHGVTSSKILSVSVLLDFAVGSSIPPSYNGSAGYEYDYYTTLTQIIIWTKSGNSANILSKPFRILITYEQ